MIETFHLKGLRIQSNRFGAVEPRAAAGTGGGRGVSAEVLAATRDGECHCEDADHMAALGLQPLQVGTPVVGPGGLLGIGPIFVQGEEGESGRWQGVPGGEGLGSGCTAGRHVCQRLSRVRRAYGV